eukprot:TRINITY_DN116155_c0_g1_i1.p1 TRINITY_DN116155_c0_g1~~TRINITY_DN116155_c0_g1_i1.p1  ORF type:complete len:620 (+),score=120.35 TRINITY_DN116155_c0_g1_i1:98-1861(+)
MASSLARTSLIAFALLADTFHGHQHGCIKTMDQMYSVEGGDHKGLVSYNASLCTATKKCPAVVVIPDWDGMNDYEAERAVMLAELGYVGFAADIYGTSTPVEDMSDWMAASSKHRGNATLYMGKIDAAIAKLKELDFVDASKVAVIGYCFGGTGIINMAILGADVLGVVGYHSGIGENARTVRADENSTIRAKVLLHSGVQDDAATDVARLEDEFEAAGAKYEIARFGSGVYHSFTHWGSAVPRQSMYDQRADYRSWESSKRFLAELFQGMPAASRHTGAHSLTITHPEYSCAESSNCTLKGYMARHSGHCSSSSRCPAVVLIHDWNGLNDYEEERSRMIAEMGYIAFAADIYSVGTPLENMADFMAASSAHRGNVTLYMSRINAAIQEVKTYDFVDVSKIAVIGYCFGGTGVVNAAVMGTDVLGVVGYHSGIAPGSRATASANSTITAKVLLHSGVKDDAAVDIASLEQELESAGATYEIVRYGSGVVHSFTEWSSMIPGMAMYDARADYRSWESTKSFFKELFEGLPAGARKDKDHECEPEPEPEPVANGTTAATSVSSATVTQLSSTLAALWFAVGASLFVTMA